MKGSEDIGQLIAVIVISLAFIWIAISAINMLSPAFLLAGILGLILGVAAIAGIIIKFLR